MMFRPTWVALAPWLPSSPLIVNPAGPVHIVHFLAILNVWTMSNYSLLASRLSTPISCSLSSYVIPCSPEMAVTIFLWTFYRLSISPLCHGHHACTAKSINWHTGHIVLAELSCPGSWKLLGSRLELPWLSWPPWHTVRLLRKLLFSLLLLFWGQQVWLKGAIISSKLKKDSRKWSFKIIFILFLFKIDIRTMDPELNWAKLDP